MENNNINTNTILIILFIILFILQIEFNIIQKLLILLIKFYKYMISPLLGNYCRFEPTCSTYSIMAIEKNGVVKGIIQTIKRVLSCNPFGSSGYDPI